MPIVLVANQSWELPSIFHEVHGGQRWGDWWKAPCRWDPTVLQTPSQCVHLRF